MSQKVRPGDTRLTYRRGFTSAVPGGFTGVVDLALPVLSWAEDGRCEAASLLVPIDCMRAARRVGAPRSEGCADSGAPGELMASLQQQGGSVGIANGSWCSAWAERVSGGAAVQVQVQVQGPRLPGGGGWAAW